MSEPASKRRRTESGIEEGSESDSENQTAMKVKRSKYWFDDGNVVLQAENTQFRVHRSMMAHHSKVFKDMFGMPQPEQAQDAMVDGCPVVILGDEPRDVELVLAVFYDNVKALDFREKMTVFQLGAYLQLGKKYEIEYLQNEALKHMRGDYPTTLDGWDETFERQNIDSNKIRLSGVARSVILLGHTMSVQSVLPAAYFTYVVHSSPEVLLCLDDKLLPQNIITDAVLGRDKIIRSMLELTQKWWTTSGFMPPAECRSHDRRSCMLHKAQVIGNLLSVIYPDDKLPFELCPWESSVIEPKICSGCMDSVQACYNAFRGEIWQRLPTFFGFGGWEGLKDFDT